MTESAAPPTPPRADVAARLRGVGGAALDWWRYYCDPSRKGHDPGVRAQLRRCDSAVDAAAIPAAVALGRRVGAFTGGEAEMWRDTAALDLARVLAHIREHTDVTPMRAAGWKTFASDRSESEAGDDRPILSEGRFRRLLTTGRGEEQVTAFVRLVDLLGGTANVAALADAFFAWGHEYYGERVRKRWAEEYFAARDFTTAPTSPAVPVPDPENDA